MTQEIFGPMEERTRLAAYDGVSTPSVLPACRLQRVLGRRAAEWTIDDLVGLVRDRGVRLISLMHIGGDGWLKTLDFAPRSVEHLRNILVGGERADGSSLFRNQGISSHASDIVLRPKLDTAFIDPFAPLPTLALLCGHQGRDGEPLPQSPDTVARRAQARALEVTGVDLWALGEVEYFIGRRWSKSDRYGADDHGYHATAPVAAGQVLRRRAIAILSEMGVPLKYAHSEVGYVKASTPGETVWEQHEIELSLAPLPRAAECMALTHWVVRNLAAELELDCSFDPIVGEGHAGNGLHIHLSPVVDGVPRGGRDGDGELYAPAKWLIGGLTQLGGALMAFGNTEPDSFVRLTQGKEAPTAMRWGEFDRQALIRLPILVTDADGNTLSTPTVEFRLSDGSAHPHFLVAGLAQALVYGHSLSGLDELLAHTTRPGFDTAISAPVPQNFAEVAAELVRHRSVLEAGGVLPASLIDRFLDAHSGSETP